MSKFIVYGKLFKNGKPVLTKELGEIVFYIILLVRVYRLEDNIPFICILPLMICLSVN